MMPRMRRWSGTCRAPLVVALLALLAGCLEPTMKVAVVLPEGFARDDLTLTLSIYAPSGERAATCEEIAFGDISVAELRAARVYDRVLLSPAGVEAAADGIAAVVPLQGPKVALALGGYGLPWPAARSWARSTGT
jgi:hypothetical protein